MGGIALLGGLIVALAVFFCWCGFFGMENPFVSHPDLNVNYFGVALGVVVIFFVGALDDVLDLKPKPKFIGQIIAACIVAASGVLLSDIRNPFGEGYIEFDGLLIL